VDPSPRRTGRPDSGLPFSLRGAGGVSKRNGVRDDYSTAERELAAALGYSEIDPPQWTTKQRSHAEWKEIRRWRKRYYRGQCSKAERDREIFRIEAASKARYEASNPRRPTYWTRTVNRYLKLRPEIIKLGGLTEKAAQALLAFSSPEETKKRRTAERRLKAFRAAERARNKQDGRRRVRINPDLLGLDPTREHGDDERLDAYVDFTEVDGFAAHQASGFSRKERNYEKASPLSFQGSAERNSRVRWAYTEWQKAERLKTARLRLLSLIRTKYDV